MSGLSFHSSSSAQPGRHKPPRQAKVGCGCDNGVVGHGREFWSPLQENQAQADVLRLFEKLLTTVPVRALMYHVYSHREKNFRFDQLDDRGQTNVLADNLATEDLLASVTEGRFISADIPFDDDILLRVGTRRVLGSPTKAIYNFWGAHRG